MLTVKYKINNQYETFVMDIALWVFVIGVSYIFANIVI
jgi:hypothetical protein